VGGNRAMALLCWEQTLLLLAKTNYLSLTQQTCTWNSLPASTTVWQHMMFSNSSAVLLLLLWNNLVEY